LLPPRLGLGEVSAGVGEKAMEEGRAMILISHMLLAHESIVDTISVDSYNQNKGCQILRAAEG